MDEHAPVDANEFVYRRIHHTLFRSDLLLPVRFAAFRPNQHDTTGLSVFRAAFVQAVDTLANLEASKQNDYYVARLSVVDLRNLGLTVVADPNPNGPAGHAIIPELNWQAYLANKQGWKSTLIALASLAGTAIVHQPS
jgi:hypothetical protein